MKQKARNQFILGLSLLLGFILFTLSLSVVDIQPIGPKGSCVAYATVNEAVHELSGVNMTLYSITDWAGVAAILLACGFGLLGLAQWINRKSIRKVDISILVLGAFYLFVFGVYVFFEFYAVNYRPVLINGILETSYPSSTTMLTACVLPTAMMQFHRLIKDRRIRNVVNTLCGLFAVFTVVGRLVCGVHWFTDIFGGLLFSAAAVLLYCAVNTFILARNDINANAD